jgi:3-dehydroquinate dehydratase/shikimate dehydrogenase
MSRVLAKKFGAFLTFASLNDSEATAPGQVTISDLRNLYRWDAIKPGTKVFGVVAHPVRHSMSPAIHNAAFSEVGFDGVYLPMLVEADYESFKSFIEGFRNFEGMNLSGLSVTIPHKENALRYLKETGSEIEELGQRIGAINTISFGPSGKIAGKNTDYAAILDSITEALGIGRDQLKGLRVAVLGAGGTGRAAVAALAHYGANVIVSNRTAERAKSLAEEFKASAMALEDICREECDVFINTTSVGMFPKIDGNPLGNLNPPFSPKTLVFDTIYNPMKTRLLIQAESCGAKTIGGVEMFVRQAAAQFETWTGKPAPREIMRRVIVGRLG